MIGILFWLLALLSCGYAAWSGGRDGRTAAVLIVAAALATIPASYVGSRFGKVELAVGAVDAALMVGLYLLAMRSRAWWPIWATAFQSIAVLSHLAAAMETGFLADVYFAASSFWAIPLLVSMVAGITLDQRARAQQGT